MGLNPDQHKIIIFEDMSQLTENSSEINELCILTSRKGNISCIFISQNLFQASRYGLTMRRNMSYFTLFRTFGDVRNIQNLGRTFFTDNSLQQAFKMLARTNKESFKNYLFLDDHEKSVLPYEMRLRSNIFDKKYPYFFLTEDY